MDSGMTKKYKRPWKHVKQLTSMVLAGVLILNLGACSAPQKEAVQAPEAVAEGSVVMDRVPLPQALQTANDAASLALRRYIFARLKTEEFLTTDFSVVSSDKRREAAEALFLAWESANQLTASAAEIADQAIVILEKSAAQQVFPTMAIHGGNPLAKALSIFGMPFVSFAAGDANQTDYQAWAENLTKQYDAIKGGQTVKQLAAQLGTDAKSAYEQLALAQDILHGEAMMDAEHWDEVVKIYQGVKTTCKVGLFVTATISSGGGSLAALSAGTSTLGQAGAVIVGGTDCIVDIAATGSNIILGEDHQVTVGFEDVKSKLAPVSAIVGLTTFNPAETGEQLTYIGDTLTDLFFEGKILGVKIQGSEDGSAKVTAKPIEITATGESAVDAALEAAGFIVPSADPKTLAEIMGGYELNPEDAIAKMDALVSELAELMKAAGLNGSVAEAETPSVTLSAEAPTTSDITGTYQNAVSGPEETETYEITISDNGDGTVTWADSEGDETIIPYNEETGELIYEEVLYLKFSSSGNAVTATGTLDFWGETASVELTKIGD